MVAQEEGALRELGSVDGVGTPGRAGKTVLIPVLPSRRGGGGGGYILQNTEAVGPSHAPSLHRNPPPAMDGVDGDDDFATWLPETFGAMVEHAKGAWLDLPSAASFLERGAARAVSIIYDAVGQVGPPVRPEAGSLFIVDERRLPAWRNDAYVYESLPPEAPLRAGVVYEDGAVFAAREGRGDAAGQRDAMELAFLSRAPRRGVL